jgi:NADH:ubiquinone oxidoreductase subunit 4 (subunit M)
VRVVLASLILKLGTLGLLHASLLLPNTVIALRVLGMGICPLLSRLQTDTKAIVAYRRVGHISTLCLSLWLQRITTTFRRVGLQTRHGLTSGLLFLLVGGRSHMLRTRTLYYGSTNNTTLFFLSTTFNAGGPVSLPFLVETYFLSGVARLGTLCMSIVLLNIVLTSYYNFYLITRRLKPLHTRANPTPLILIQAFNLSLALT